MAEANVNDVDPRLVSIINKAAEDFPFDVKIISGKREGDPRFHGKGQALDVALYDPDTGKMIPNYQDANAFRTYEQFAQKVRQTQQDLHPDLSDKLRWGGYFSGAPGKYGAADLMHFDLGAHPGLGMAGGSWETGLHPEQAKLYPGVQSVGLGNSPKTEDARSTFEKVQAQAADIAPNQIASIYKAYKAGTMTPEERTQFETDVNQGRVMLPVGASIESAPAVKSIDSAIILPQGVIDAYNKAAENPYFTGGMPVEERKQLDSDIANGIVKLPPGVKLNQTYPGIIDHIKEAVTGDLRQTDATKHLPELMDRNAPGLFQGSEVSATQKALLSTALVSATDPHEIARLLKATSPDIGIAEDEKGNLIAANNKTGAQVVINKPGFTKVDLMQNLGLLAAFTPSAKAATIGGAVVANAATQAALEASHKAAGGTFEPSEVALAGGAGGLAQGALNVVQAVKGPAQQIANRALGRGAGEAATAEAGAGAGLAPGASVNDPAALSASLARDTRPIAPASPVAAPAAPAAPAVAPQAAPTLAEAVAPAAKTVTTLPADELTKVAKQAAEGGIGSGGAKKTLAEQVAPNPKTVEAAQRLGIEQHLQPDHITTNQAFRELTQGVKSIPGSEARSQELTGLNAVAQRADKLITEIGGTHDISSLSGDIKNSLQATHKELDTKAEQLYKTLRDNIPAKAPVEAENVLNFIRQRSEDLGGVANLSSLEKTILGKLTPKEGASVGNSAVADITQRALNGEKLSREEAKTYLAARFGNGAKAETTAPTKVMPTYALMDDVRRDIGNGLKNAGPFKDEDTGLKKKLYSLISNDQAKVADEHGMSEVFKQAKNAVQVRKGVEDDLASLFGKNIDGSMQAGLTTAVSSLPKGDPTKLINMIKTVPESLRQQTVASGLNSAFGKNAKNGLINFNSYAKWYEGLLANKQSYHAIMANLPSEARKQLSDLYRVSKGISMATRERITTGRIQAIKDEFQGPDGLMHNIYSMAGKAGKGLAMEAATSMVGMHGAGLTASLASALTKGKTPAIKAADALIASDEFRAAVSHAAKGDIKKAAPLLAYSRPFIKFARSVGNPRELSNKEQWVMKALAVRNNEQN